MKARDDAAYQPATSATIQHMAGIGKMVDAIMMMKDGDQE